MEVNMQQPWMDEFVESFKAPEIDPKIVGNLKIQMREILKEELREESTEKKRDLINPTSYVIGITLISIPIFLYLNYSFYMMIQSLNRLLLPPISYFLGIVFLMIATFMGALCYGTIPIWTAYWVKQGRIIE